MSAALHRAWLEELLVKGHRDDVETWFSRIHELEQTLMPPLPRGPAGIHRALDALASMFSDWYVTVNRQITQGDSVLTHFDAYATHVGRVGVMRPTGKMVMLTGMLWSRFSGPRACETILEVSALEMLEALGAFRAPPIVSTPEVEEGAP